MTRPLTFLGMLLAAAATYSCGGAQAPQAPAATSTDDPGYARPEAPGAEVGSGADEEAMDDFAQAEEALAQAERKLAGAFGEGDSGAPPVALSNGSNRCELACEALSSMVRATDRLCTLAGPDDTRCGSAQERLHSATDRVQTECPTCPD